MRVGTMFLGEVDSQGGQSAQTKFFVLGVPLFPVESYWATQNTVSGVIGFPIPLHGKSVGFGYLRIYAWLGALLGAVIGYVTHHSYRPSYGLFGLAAVCLVVAVVSTFFLGGVDAQEARRREILFRATRLYAPPEVLGPEKRIEISRALLDRWKKVGGGTTWTARIDSGQAKSDELPLLFALARYGEDGPRAEAAARSLSV